MEISDLFSAQPLFDMSIKNPGVGQGRGEMAHLLVHAKERAVAAGGSDQVVGGTLAWSCTTRMICGVQGAMGRVAKMRHLSSRKPLLALDGTLDE